MHREFHRAVCAASCYDVMIKLPDDLWNKSDRYRRIEGVGGIRWFSPGLPTTWTFSHSSRAPVTEAVKLLALGCGRVRQLRRRRPAMKSSRIW